MRKWIRNLSPTTEDVNFILQWTATAFILLGYLFNALNVNIWSQIAYTSGAILWFSWSWRVGLTSQIVLNSIVSIIGIAGLAMLVYLKYFF